MKLLETFTLVTLLLLKGGDSAPQTFEVASIKPVPVDDNKFQIGVSPGGTFTARNVTVKYLIRWAYEIPDFRIQGGPQWFATDRYDIIAKAEGNASDAQMRLMVQALLTDRFKLALHRETREGTVFDLVVGKNGPKLPEAEADEPGRNAAEVRRPAAAKMPQGMAILVERVEGADLNTALQMASAYLTYRGITVSTFANHLADVLHTPVLDRTGLTGTYDFHIEYGFGDRSSSASIFTVLQEQLGLKLQSQKGPVNILVIDRVERPSKN